MTCIREYTGHTEGVNDLAAWDEVLISASSDNTIRLWTQVEINLNKKQRKISKL